MVKLPRYEQQVQPDTSVIPSVPSNTGNPGLVISSMNKNAEAVQSAASAVGDIGQKLYAHAQKLQTLQLKKKNAEFDTQFRQELQDKLYSPDQETVTVNGQDITRPKGIYNRSLKQAEGSRAEFEDYYATTRQKYLSQVSDPEAQLALANSLDNQFLSARDNVYSHEAKQMREDLVNGFKSNISQQIKDAANSTDLKSLTESVSNAVETQKSLNEALGLDPATSKLAEQKTIADVIESSTSAALMNDLSGATSMKLLDAAKPVLDAKDYDELASGIKVKSKKIIEDTKASVKLAKNINSTKILMEVADGNFSVFNVKELNRMANNGEISNEAATAAIRAIEKPIADYDIKPDDEAFMERVKGIFEASNPADMEKNLIDVLDGFSSGSLSQERMTLLFQAAKGQGSEKAVAFRENFKKLYDWGVDAGVPVTYQSQVTKDYIEGLNAGKDPVEAAEIAIKRATASQNDSVRAEDLRVSETPKDNIGFSDRVMTSPVMNTLFEGLTSFSKNRAVKAIGLGQAGMVEGVGGAAKLVGLKDFGDAVSKEAKLMQKTFEIKDPKFLDKLGMGASSSLSFFVPGLAVAKGVTMLRAAPVIAVALGVSTSSVMESSVEAGGNYEEAKRRGMTDEQAKQVGGITFWLNMPLLVGTNILGGLFNPEAQAVKKVGKKMTVDRIIKAVAEKGIKPAVAEGTQEGLQEVSSNVAIGDPALQNARESAIIGAIVGTGLGAVTSFDTNAEKKPVIKKDAPVDNTVKDKTGKPLSFNVEPGVENEVAVDPAIEKISNDIAVKKAVIAQAISGVETIENGGNSKEVALNSAIASNLELISGINSSEVKIEAAKSIDKAVYQYFLQSGMSKDEAATISKQIYDASFSQKTAEGYKQALIESLQTAIPTWRLTAPDSLSQQGGDLYGKGEEGQSGQEKDVLNTQGQEAETLNAPVSKKGWDIKGTELRDEVSNVRYGKPGEILFDFRGETYSSPEPKDILPVGSAADKSWAVRQILDKNIKIVSKTTSVSPSKFKNIQELKDYYESNIVGVHKDVLDRDINFKYEHFNHLLKVDKNGKYSTKRSRSLPYLLDLIKNPDEIRGAEVFSKKYPNAEIYLKEVEKEGHRILLAAEFDGKNFTPITTFDNLTNNQIENIKKGKLIYKKNAGLSDQPGSEVPARVTEGSKVGNFPQQDIRQTGISKPNLIVSQNIDNVNNPNDSENIKDFGEKIGGARKDTAEKGFVKGTMKKPETSQPAWKNKYIAAEKVDKSGWTIIRKDTPPYMIMSDRGQVFATREEAEKAIPIRAVADNHRVYQNKNKKWEIFKKVGERKLFKVVNKEFNEREEAMRYMALHAEEILNLKTNFGEEILPVPEIANRKGIERRTKNADAKMFMGTFAPRGIEFGNWNNQEERQQVLNHAYDGLLDLADVLGISPKDLMLNGELGIAFGARGQGLSGAKAHYERDYGVINLTKMKGAGSLAHEWFHALDNHLARIDGKAKAQRIKDSKGNLIFPSSKSDYLSEGASYQSKLDKELLATYKKLIDTMYRKGEQYVESTEVADKFVAKAREEVKNKLDKIRDHLAKPYEYARIEKFKKPASVEQLAEFDKLANTIIEGGNLETKFREIPGVKNMFKGRNTNDALESISAILKSVRNRTGFGSHEMPGTLDDLRSLMSLYKTRLQMFKEAEGKVEKTKTVPTNYAIEARKMDQSRTGDYWSEPTEMAARAFSAYVEDKVAQKGWQSDFIVYHAHGGIFLPMIDGYVARPYPEGSERTAINTEFDKFFDRVKSIIKRSGTEQNDAGIKKGLSSESGSVVLPGVDQAAEFIQKLADPELQEGIYQKGVNRFQSLENAAEKAKALALFGLPVGEDPGLSATRYLSIANQSDATLRAGVYNITPSGKVEILSEGLKPILNDYEKSSTEKNEETRREELNKYLVARRTVQDLQRPKSETDTENIVTPEQVAKAQADLDALQAKYGSLDLFDQTAQRVYAYQKALLSKLVESGAMSKENFENILSLNPNYVPFNRILPEDEPSIVTPKNKNRFSGARSPIKKIQGSELEVEDVIESIIKNTYRIMDVSARNKVFKDVYNLKDIDALGIKAIAPDMRPIGVTEKETGSEDITIFRPSQFKPKGNIVEGFINGKHKYLEVPKNMHDAMTGLDEVSSGLLIKILSQPTNWLRTGATITPEFIARNPIRDQWTALLQTHVGFRPFVDPGSAIADIFDKSEIYNDWVRSGGSYASFVELSRPQVSKMANELLGRPDLMSKLNIVNGLQNVSQLMEQATRLGVYKAGIRSGLSPLEAAKQSRESTLDFARRGSNTKDINSLIAFFNAGVQSFDKMVRTAKEDPVGMTTKALVSITLPSLLLYLKNRDEDDYKELPRWQKDLFWMTKINSTWVRIPKPFAFGQIFGSLPERFMEYLETKDPKALDNLAQSLYDSLSPVSGDPASGLLPTGIKPLLENEANWSFFRQRAIVPMGQERLLPKEQYTKYDTETSKVLGNILNISPSKIENLVSGYFGGSGRYVLQGGELFLDTVKKMRGEEVPQKLRELSDVPLVKGFVARDPVGGQSESVQNFYNTKKELNALNATFKKYNKDGDVKKADALLKSNPELEFSKVFDSAYEKMKNIDDRVEKITASNEATKEKKSKILELNKTKTVIAKDVLKSYQQFRGK